MSVEGSTSSTRSSPHARPGTSLTNGLTTVNQPEAGGSGNQRQSDACIATSSQHALPLREVPDAEPVARRGCEQSAACQGSLPDPVVATENGERVQSEAKEGKGQHAWKAAASLEGVSSSGNSTCGRFDGTSILPEIVESELPGSLRRGKDRRGTGESTDTMAVRSSGCERLFLIDGSQEQTTLSSLCNEELEEGVATTAAQSSCIGAQPLYPNIVQSHGVGAPATVLQGTDVVPMDLSAHQQLAPEAHSWYGKDSVSDWEFCQRDVVQDVRQNAIRVCGPSTQGARDNAHSLSPAQGNVIPGSVPRHQSAILGARLAWGATANPHQGFVSPRVTRVCRIGEGPPMQLPRSSSLNRSRNESHSDTHLCSRPASRSSFDSKESLKESLNNGRDQHDLGPCSRFSIGVTTAAQHYTYALPRYSRTQLSSSCPIEHSSLGLPHNATYLSASGCRSRPDSLYPHGLPCKYKGEYHNKGPFRLLGRHIKTAGKEFVKSFWVVVALVAVVAGAMGFEEQRRGSVTRRLSRRMDSNKDDGSEDGWGYSAASFMG